MTPHGFNPHTLIGRQRYSRAGTPSFYSRAVDVPEQLEEAPAPRRAATVDPGPVNLDVAPASLFAFWVATAAGVAACLALIVGMIAIANGVLS